MFQACSLSSSKEEDKVPVKREKMPESGKTWILDWSHLSLFLLFLDETEESSFCHPPSLAPVLSKKIFATAELLLCLCLLFVPFTFPSFARQII